jgi:PAS domain S-box-containing protein
MGYLLIVDDEKALVKTLQNILEDAGHAVLPALSGKEALSHLKHADCDLALVDLKLEDISGFDLIKIMNDKYPDVIVIILTGFASVDSAIKALRMGAYDYLQKPVKPELLIKTVERGLEKKQLKALAEAVIKKMDEGIALLDSEGLIDFASTRFCNMVQYSAEELTGYLFFSLVSPHYEYTANENFKKARQGQTKRIQASLIRKDGREITALVSFTTVGNRVLTVVSDITQVVGVPVARKDLMYKVTPGSVYLITEKTLEKAMEAFTDLLQAGYGGLLVTRNHPEEVKAVWNIDVSVLWLTDEVISLQEQGHINRSS